MDPVVLTILNAALQILISLVGFPAVLSLLLAFGMKFANLSAALAANISLVVNLIAFVGIAYLVATGHTAVVPAIDSLLIGVAAFLAKVAVVVGVPTLMYVNTAKYSRGIAEHLSHFQAAYALHRGLPLKK